MSKRNIFGELMEGVDAMREQREGKLTLRTHKVHEEAPPPVDAAYIRETRETLHMSAPVFARCLRVSQRTLERWEQGQKPAPAAQVLIGLVRRYPDTLERIAGLDSKPKSSSRKSSGRLLGHRVRKAASRRKPT